MKDLSTQPQTCTRKHIPDIVVPAIDKILRQKYSSNLNCTITVKELLALIPECEREVAKTDIFYDGWRYYASLYEQRGWTVIFNKSSNDKAYDANFTFKSK